MYKSEQYSYKVFWSDNDEGYRATVLEFPGLSNIADTQDEALHGIVDLVGTVLEEMEKDGDAAPEPPATKVYS